MERRIRPVRPGQRPPRHRRHALQHLLDLEALHERRRAAAARRGTAAARGPGRQASSVVPVEEGRGRGRRHDRGPPDPRLRASRRSRTTRTGPRRTRSSRPTRRSSPGSATPRRSTRPELNFQYSNLGFTLAGEIVAATSGTPYAAYVRQRILDPLRLGDTTPEIPAAERGKRLATGYSARDREGRRRPSRSSPPTRSRPRPATPRTRRPRAVRLLAVPADREGGHRSPEGHDAARDAAGPLARAGFRDALGAGVRGLEERREDLRRPRGELPGLPHVPAPLQRRSDRHGLHGERPEPGFEGVGPAALRHRRARRRRRRQGARQGKGAGPVVTGLRRDVRPAALGRRGRRPPVGGRPRDVRAADHEPGQDHGTLPENRRAPLPTDPQGRHLGEEVVFEMGPDGKATRFTQHSNHLRRVR